MDPSLEFPCAGQAHSQHHKYVADTSAGSPGRRAAKTAAGQGQAYWFFGGKTIIRSPEGARPVIIEMELAPSGHARLHVHLTIDDSLYLLSGQIVVRCGDDTVVAEAGDSQRADGHARSGA